jgi:hypothetical protein
LEYAVSEYFKFQGTEEEFEKHLKEIRDDEIKKSDAKADDGDIQGGPEDQRGGSE